MDDEKKDQFYLNRQMLGMTTSGNIPLMLFGINLTLFGLILAVGGSSGAVGLGIGFVGLMISFVGLTTRAATETKPPAT